MDPRELLFYLNNKHSNGSIAFRSLDITNDMDTIHDWVNQPYAKRYWKMEMDKASLQKEYATMLSDPLKHSFIGLFNNQMVCQIDCYNVSAEELKDHVEPNAGSCGLHILMCPPRELTKRLTETMLKAFIKFYFSFSVAETLYGEPDEKNTPANIAAKRSGFQFQKTIQLSYKTANLYAINKNNFHEQQFNEQKFKTYSKL